jgi:hypothetical protein
MNGLVAIIFIAFVGGGMFVNIIKDKYEKPAPAPIEQVQPVSGDTVADGDTATVNK